MPSKLDAIALGFYSFIDRHYDYENNILELTEKSLPGREYRQGVKHRFAFLAVEDMEKYRKGIAVKFLRVGSYGFGKIDLEGKNGLSVDFEPELCESDQPSKSAK